MAELLESLRSYISPDLISRTSRELGESEPATAKAFGGVIPTVLAGLVSRTSEPGVMSSIYNMIRGSDRNLLSNWGNTVPGAPDAAAPVGHQFLSQIFGNNVDRVNDGISNFAGIKSSSVSAILAYVAPLVLGFLGKKTHDDELDEAGLSSYLNSQKAGIMSALPPGLGSMLGLGGLGAAAAAAAPHIERPSAAPAAAAATERVHHTPVEPRKKTNWLWPLLAIAALLLLIFGLRNCNDDAENVTTEPTTTTVPPATTEEPMQTRQSDANFTEREIPGGVVLNIPPDGIESKLVAFIEDKSKVPDKTTWFSFDRLHFETGSARIQPESQEQIDNIVKILQAYPNVNIKIGGYTDNVGQPAANLKLSQSRAEAVRNAIQQQGIAANRLEAEGYGEQHPVADNTTEEGRAQNRRIDVLVTKK
ncbi:OmpA family protein [Pontibacter ramchanderi]|uniref:Outer membrane protein OmpA-like peptidoglycan-associated protein n=1 Tax=Pontibacter ramchanderi TaxID=1179743 RepID=A0A2N3V0H3_9BACT|nr:OmpA family protein [Pontibacter ramchanderi]PKV75141.1 outer membrane protein OmpA-like peptidoglycan-associated protein [Pontibacter ramchanderi]